MKKASITEVKNGLSALLDRVRRGEPVLIEDRGVPVARLEPVGSWPGGADDGRLARLERAGILRRPVGRTPKALLATPPPRLASGARLSAMVLEEREDGR